MLLIVYCPIINCSRCDKYFRWLVGSKTLNLEKCLDRAVLSLGIDGLACWGHLVWTTFYPDPICFWPTLMLILSTDQVSKSSLIFWRSHYILRNPVSTNPNQVLVHNTYQGSVCPAVSAAKCEWWMANIITNILLVLELTQHYSMGHS